MGDMKQFTKEDIRVTSKYGGWVRLSDWPVAPGCGAGLGAPTRSPSGFPLGQTDPFLVLFCFAFFHAYWWFWLPGSSAQSGHTGRTKQKPRTHSVVAPCVLWPQQAALVLQFSVFFYCCVLNYFQDRVLFTGEEQEKVNRYHLVLEPKVPVLNIFLASFCELLRKQDYGSSFSFFAFMCIFW